MAETPVEELTEPLLCLFNGDQIFNPDMGSCDWTLADPVLPALEPQLLLLDNGQLAFTNGLQLLVNPLGLVDAKQNPSDMYAVSSFLPLLVPATCDNLNFQPEEDTMDSQLNDSNEALGDSEDLEEGLDEELNSLVDVVMTFKCKMCQHPASSKQLLLEHIVSEHVENKDGQEDDCASEHSNVDPDDPDVAEKLVFLCAQCAEPFDSLESCRRHMVEDHRLVTEEQDKKALSQVKTTSVELSEILASLPEIAEEPTPVVAEPKLEVPEQSPEVSPEEPTPQPVNPTPENSIEPRAKRKTNLPKALENGFVLGQNYKNGNSHYKCDSLGCIAKFSSEKELDLHVLCHNTEKRNFQCCECRQEFAVWKPCSVHLWRSHQIDVGMLTCKICGSKCATNMKMKNHMRIHSSARNFKCEVCNKSFKQLSQLKNHSVIHADRTSSEAMASSRWYTAKQCHICHKTYADAKCLKKHLAQVHRKLKPYSCPVCSHTCARKAMLQLHLRQHTGEKPYVCEYCDFRTGDHNSLRRHKMRHTGKKMYQCPHCSYSCIQSNAYKNHLRCRHPEQEGVVFECSECPFRTVKEPNFIAHQGDHKREERATQLAQLHDNTFPGNVAAANLIFRCLDNIGDREGRNLRANVTGHHTSSDGATQTITIRIPAEEEDDGCIKVEELVRQQRHVEVPDEPDLGGITIPADPTPPPHEDLPPEPLPHD